MTTLSDRAEARDLAMRQAADRRSERRPKRTATRTRTPDSTFTERIRRNIDMLEALVELRDDGAEIAPALDLALARMERDRPGHPGAASYESVGRRPGPGSKAPPGTDRPDNGGEARQTYAHRASQLDRLVRELTLDALLWVPHAPTPGVEAQAEPECTWTRSVLNKHVPRYRRGDVGGRLDKPMDLGEWPYHFVLANGRLPSEDEMIRHDKGQRVMVRAS